nr:HipA domain-containing protein [Methylobacterium radiodurans]
MNFDPSTRTVRYDAGEGLPDGYGHWLLKFGPRDDPAEIGAEEYAYSLMARAAGVVMPEADLIRTKAGSYFTVSRFDHAETCRVHLHTASGLAEADHRLPGAMDSS